MKVKLRKCKNSPAPFKIGQVLVASSGLNLYSAIQETIKKNEPFLTN